MVQEEVCKRSEEDKKLISPNLTCDNIGRRKTHKKTTGNKQSGGGAFHILEGVERIRGQKYEKWLEQRLVSHFNDVAFVNEVRTKFGYDKTNIRGRGQLTKQMIEKEICERTNDERKLIEPNLKCGSKEGRKSRRTRKTRRSRKTRKNHKK